METLLNLTSSKANDNLVPLTLDPHFTMITTILAIQTKSGNYTSYTKNLLFIFSNVVGSDSCLNQFISHHIFPSFVKADSCFKSLVRPSYINLMLTNAGSKRSNIFS